MVSCVRDWMRLWVCNKLGVRGLWAPLDAVPWCGLVSPLEVPATPVRLGCKGFIVTCTGVTAIV